MNALKSVARTQRVNSSTSDPDFSHFKSILLADYIIVITFAKGDYAFSRVGLICVCLFDLKLNKCE